MAARGGPDESYFLDSAALNLHGVYNGIERLFEAIARDLDDSVPGGPTWLRDLLLQMELDVPSVRPAVIRAATRAALEDYLGFRHIVRNLYTWDFVPKKLEALTNKLSVTLTDLEQDLDRFRAFLDSAGRADESNL